MWETTLLPLLARARLSSYGTQEVQAVQLSQQRVWAAILDGSQAYHGTLILSPPLISIILVTGT